MAANVAPTAQRVDWTTATGAGDLDNLLADLTIKRGDWEDYKLVNPALFLYRHSLELADVHQIRSIAFPCIATGIYAYPPEQAAQIAVDTVRDIAPTLSHVEEIIFCCFHTEDAALYQSLLKTEN